MPNFTASCILSGAVTATEDLTNANWGSGNSAATLAQSPNTNGVLSTQEQMETINVLNVHPDTNAVAGR